MKKALSIILAIAILSVLFVLPAGAVENNSNDAKGYEIEYLDNGDYIVTYLEDDTTFIPDSGEKATTVTKSKTSKYYNSAGDTMWFITVTGKFTYNGTTSSCKEVAHAAGAPGITWSILSASSSKSGNKATATATARHNLNPGYSDYTRSVTLKCSATGVFS